MVMVYARNSSTFVKGQLIRGWSKLETVERLHQAGSFTLVAPDYDGAGLNDLYGSLAEPGIFVDDDGHYFGGTATTLTDDSTRPRLTITGKDDQQLLEERIFYPDEATEAPWAVAHYEPPTPITAGKALIDSVSEQMGPAALVSRRIATLTVENTATAGPWTIYARLETIAEQQRIAAASVGTVSRILTTDGALKFKAWNPVACGVEFSETRRNVRRWRRTVTAPTATTVIAGGAGDGTARTFTTTSSATDPRWPRRRELFLDASSAGTALGSKAEEARAAGEATASLEVEAEGIPGYGTVWKIGDFATVDVGGVNTQLQIVAVKTVWEAPNKMTRTVSLGTESLRGIDVLTRKIREAQQASAGSSRR